jgi:hypothetical protein
MRRTTVYLPDDLKAALVRASEQSGQSQAELIREGVRLVAKQYAPTVPILVSPDPRFAENVDEHLAGFGR